MKGRKRKAGSSDRKNGENKKSLTEVRDDNKEEGKVEKDFSQGNGVGKVNDLSKDINNRGKKSELAKEDTGEVKKGKRSTEVEDFNKIDEEDEIENDYEADGSGEGEESEEEIDCEEEEEEEDDDDDIEGSEDLEEDDSDEESEEEDSDDDEEVEDEEDNEEGDVKDNELINVEFEFFDPKPVDFDGVRSLLNVYLGNEVWELDRFCNLIISQTTVGTVLKIAEEESPIGLISCLNLNYHKDKECVSQIVSYLQKRCSKKTDVQKFESLLASCGFTDTPTQPSLVTHQQNLGLFVSERLINVPFQIAGPLHDAIFDEIRWAQEDEPTEELRKSFEFKKYIILTKVFQENTKEKKNKKNNDCDNVKKDSDFIFVKPEDEIFLELCDWHFTFPLNVEALAARQIKGMKELKLVMVVDGAQIDAFKSKLKSWIENGV